jgi:hypothetical protein
MSWEEIGFPYPTGEEREEINKAFDELFEELEAEETDKGVALASLAEGVDLDADASLAEGGQTFTLAAFQRPEFMKQRGRKVGVGSLRQMVEKADIKTGDRLVMLEILDGMEGQKSVLYDDFEQAVIVSLVPFTRKETDSYADYGFGRAFAPEEEESDSNEDADNEDDDGAFEDDDPVSQLYDKFEHKSIILSMPGLSYPRPFRGHHFGNYVYPSEGEFGHIRIWEETDGDTLHIAEMQSDPFQGGSKSLDQVKEEIAEKTTKRLKELEEELKDKVNEVAKENPEAQEKEKIIKKLEDEISDEKRNESKKLLEEENTFNEDKHKIDASFDFKTRVMHDAYLNAANNLNNFGIEFDGFNIQNETDSRYSRKQNKTGKPYDGQDRAEVLQEILHEVNPTGETLNSADVRKRKTELFNALEKGYGDIRKERESKISELRVESETKQRDIREKSSHTRYVMQDELRKNQRELDIILEEISAKETNQLKDKTKIIEREHDAEIEKAKNADLPSADKRMDAFAPVFEERLLREAVWEGISREKHEVLFPTPDTLAKIEGYQNPNEYKGVLRKYEKLPERLAKMYGKENVFHPGDGWVHLKLTSAIKNKPTVYYSVPTGKSLASRKPGRGILLSRLKEVVKKLGKDAANAAPVETVQSFDELPEHVRKAYKGKERIFEGAYDPTTGKVWLVAENLTSSERAAEVWMHEQVGHHGLRGLFSAEQRGILLDRLWKELGGMGNATLKALAGKYGLNPIGNKADARRLTEEYIARLAEKARREELSAQEKPLWKRIVEAVRYFLQRMTQTLTGRETRGTLDVEGLLKELGRYVFDGVPANAGLAGERAGAAASVGGANKEAGHKAWEQVQKDTEEWGRQLDEWKEGKQPERSVLQVGNTPDVLKKLGAKAKMMVMVPRNLNKIHNTKDIPLEIIKRLPEELANPLMVFKSATMADSLVVLTELEHNGENLIVAVHLNVYHGAMQVNDIASVHDRATRDDNGKIISPGWQWFKGQIEKGNLRYYDKNRSSRWFREQSGLQLPRVINRESYRGVKILTDKDIVKPIKPENEKNDTVLASLSSVLGMKPSNAAQTAGQPEINHFFKENDISLLRRLTQLPHWIAKQHPKFAKIYERQLKRLDERAAKVMKSLEQTPSLFGKDRLNKADMNDLRKLIWDNDGKQIEKLEGVDKFLDEGETEGGRTLLKINPEFYAGYGMPLLQMDAHGGAAEWIKAAGDALAPQPEQFQSEIALNCGFLFRGISHYAQGVEYCQQGHAHIGKDGFPQSAQSAYAQAHDQHLDAQGQDDVLPDHLAYAAGDAVQFVHLEGRVV